MYMFVCHVHVHNLIWSCVKCFSTSFGCFVCVLEHSCHTGNDEQKKTLCRMLCIFPWTFEAIHALRDFCTNTSNCYALWWGPVTSKLPTGALLSFAVCWFLPFAAFACGFFRGATTAVYRSAEWCCHGLGSPVSCLKGGLRANGQLPLRVIPLWFGDFD